MAGNTQACSYIAVSAVSVTTPGPVHEHLNANKDLYTQA